MRGIKEIKELALEKKTELKLVRTELKELEPKITFSITTFSYNGIFLKERICKLNAQIELLAWLTEPGDLRGRVYTDNFDHTRPMI